MEFLAREDNPGLQVLDRLIYLCLTLICMFDLISLKLHGPSPILHLDPLNKPKSSWKLVPFNILCCCFALPLQTSRNRYACLSVRKLFLLSSLNQLINQSHCRLYGLLVILRVTVLNAETLSCVKVPCARSWIF